jgi:peptidoglycan/LPS O-acetylase OafA/YrhL
MKKIEYLQVLRGIAAILVCCFHARKGLNIGSFNLGDLLFRNGFLGIQIFFILSGFLMVQTTRISNQSPLINFKNFLIKRVVRIAPLYCILTLSWIIFLENNLKLYLLDYSGIISLIKILTFIPISKYPPLYVGWTLNYEMFFYLIFAFSLFFSKLRFYFIYCVILGLVFILPSFFHLQIDLTKHHPTYFDSFLLNQISSPLLLQFLLGVIIGNIYDKIKLNKKVTYLLAVLALIIFTLFYFGLIQFYLSDLVICGFLVFSLIQLEKLESVPKPPKFLVYLGDISYSIYLVHPFIIHLTPLTLQSFSFAYKPYFIFLLQVLITIIASVIVFEFIEKKISKQIKKTIPSAFA